jgi:hypothetical protein
LRFATRARRGRPLGRLLEQQQQLLATALCLRPGGDPTGLREQPPSVVAVEKHDEAAKGPPPAFAHREREEELEQDEHRKTALPAAHAPKPD